MWDGADFETVSQGPPATAVCRLQGPDELVPISEDRRKCYRGRALFPMRGLQSHPDHHHKWTRPGQAVVQRAQVFPCRCWLSGFRAMLKVADFRQHAADCRHMAQTAQPVTREQLLKMASAWDELAETRLRELQRQGKIEDDDERILPPDNAQDTPR